MKLYNASNFFDPLAVPDEDVDAIVEAVGGFEVVTVESHPTLVAERAVELARRLPGALEVAMGLETTNPEILPRLNKAMSVDDFAAATDRLLGAGAAVRAFVLVGVPFLAAAEQVDWAVRSARDALRLGARHVSLIPVRGGNGTMERLEAAGDWQAPTLESLERSFETLLAQSGAADDVETGGVVSVDTWDLERFSSCPSCFADRRERLVTMNLTGRVIERRGCEECGWQ